jgi:hypothetical protein
MEHKDNFAKLALRHKYVAMVSGALVVVSAGGMYAFKRSAKPGPPPDLANVTYEESIALFRPGGQGRRLRPLAEAAVRIAAAEDGISRDFLRDNVRGSTEDFISVTRDLKGWGLAVGKYRQIGSSDGLGQQGYNYWKTDHLMRAIDPLEAEKHPQLKVLHEAAGRIGIDLEMVHDAFLAIEHINSEVEPEPERPAIS